MITINVVKVNEKEYLTGVIGKDQYKIEFSESAKDYLVLAKANYSKCETMEEANKVTEAAVEYVETQRKADSSDIETVLDGDLYFNKKTNTYHIQVDDKIDKNAIPKFFVDKMIESNDKGLSPKPWLIFWVRLMRNKMFRNDAHKVTNIINFLKAQYVDESKIAKLMEEEGYANDVARALCTYDQISITEEGLLASFKYVQLADDKHVIEKDEKTGEQSVVIKARYETEMEVDDVTGEITKNEKVLPSVSEDIVFLPPMMGTNGDAFTCHSISEEDEKEGTLGHKVQVGKIHELPKGFSQVNCDDDNSCVKGLHLGGYYYVQGYGGKTSYLLDCLVAPEDIGAVCDVSGGQHAGREGAIRVRRYMAVGAHFSVSRGMYHPSKYASFLDSEWKTAKDEAIKEAMKAVDEITDQL